jgi:hypothetical protein
LHVAKGVAALASEAEFDDAGRLDGGDETEGTDGAWQLPMFKGLMQLPAAKKAYPYTVHSSQKITTNDLNFSHFSPQLSQSSSSSSSS